MPKTVTHYFLNYVTRHRGGVSASKQRHIISRKLGGVSVKQSLHYYASGIHYYEDAQNGKNAIQ